MFEEHSSSFSSPYLFNGKELDRETNLSYYGARYLDIKTSLWLNVDPLAEKVPNVGAFVYGFNNPIKFIDPDGRDPITAIVEAIASFSMSAGTDFLSNWIIEGKDYKTAFKEVAWGSAALDGLITYGLSSLVNGSGSASVMAKIAKSKAGKFAIDVSKSMITSIISKYEKGDIDELSDLDLTSEFIEATFTTLLDKGLGKRADELMESLKDSNKKLYSKLTKLQRNIQLEKNEIRLKRDLDKFNTAIKNTKKAANEYLSANAKKELKKKVVVEGTKAAVNRLNSDPSKKEK